MNKLCSVKITCTAENALKKLKKAQIPVYDCKKEGAFFIFSVKDKDIKKAFAIFSKPCYNVVAERRSARQRILSRALLRIGLIAGALIFAAAAYISDFFILRVEVTGSGSYLKSEVLRLVAGEGANVGKPFSGFNASAAAGKILALPDVVFCDIKKKGSVLSVDVQTETSFIRQDGGGPLVSDADGKVKNIFAVCGTPAVSAGDEVFCGDALIEPYVIIDGKPESCRAAGYAELECSASYEYFAPDDSEENVKNAYASVLLEEKEVTARSHKVYGDGDGVKIVVYIEYLHRVSINLT